MQGVHSFDAATIVTLDTLNEDTPDHAGILCEARLGFLEEALASAPADRPLLLFQHHPPFDSGLRYMDTIKLANGEAEWDVIARTRKPDYLFMGHLHRPISGLWRGIPFHIQRALTHQVAFDFETEDHIPGSHEAPDYSHVTVDRATRHPSVLVPLRRTAVLAAGPRRAGVDRPVISDDSRLTVAA